jgi:hypothetical protein
MKRKLKWLAIVLAVSLLLTSGAVFLLLLFGDSLGSGWKVRSAPPSLTDRLRDWLGYRRDK